MIKSKKNFVFSNYYLLRGNKKFKSGYLSLFKEGYVTQSLLDNYWLGILTVLMDKKLFKKRKFNSDYEIIGDFDFFVKLSINNYFGYISKPLAFYRVHNNNFSQKKIDLWIKELKSWIEKNSDSFIKKGFNLSKQKKYLYKLKIKNFFNYVNKNSFLNTYKNKKIIITMDHTGFKGAWLTYTLCLLGAKILGISKNILTKPSLFKTLNLQKSEK